VRACLGAVDSYTLLAYIFLVRIVRTRIFEKSLKKLGATETDITSLEEHIAANPDAGTVIRGLGGARKVRFSMKGKGKRGGGRAVYLVVVVEDVAYMLLAYAKSEKTDLTSDDKRAVAAMIKELQHG
jgi:hypothetical protein